MYRFTLQDGSVFELPKEWEAAYDERMAPLGHAAVEARLRFLVGKYAEHQAAPSKFDGILCGDTVTYDADPPPFLHTHAEDDDSRYDCDTYYGEKVDTVLPLPKLAEQVMYQNLRMILMQQVLNDYAQKHGTKPVRVMTPESFLEELGDGPAKDPPAKN